MKMFEYLYDMYIINIYNKLKKKSEYVNKFGHYFLKN